MTETVFLVKAHNQPGQLGRLLWRLDVPWAHSLVHIDGKVGLETFRSHLGNTGNVSFLPDELRVPVHWAGFSNAYSTLVSAHFALTQFPKARRFIVVSGADYPAMPLSEMRERLVGDEEFVRVDRKLSQQGHGANDRFIQRRNFGDNIWANERDAKVPLLPRAAKYLGRFVRPRMPKDFDIYHGSDWYALTREGLQTVLDLYDRRPELLRFFRQVRSPVEMIVQSALMASPLKTRIADAPGSEAIHPSVRAHVRGSHYIDWSAGGSHPRTLGIQDFENVKESGAFFLRKIDPVKSRELIDALDAVHERRSPLWPAANAARA
jgi:hypothetical protein